MLPSLAAAVVAVALAGAAASARAQQAPPEDPPAQAAGEQPGEPGEAVPAEPEKEPDPCSIRPEEGDEWIDWTRKGLYRSVCASARWLDGFFGDARFDEEATSALYGRAGLGLSWSQYDRFEALSDFRANIPLPNIDERLSVTLARQDEDEYVEDRLEPSGPVPPFVAATEDRSWLLGLGYTPISGRNSRLHYSLGVNIDWPPEPYVKARYRYRFFFSERAALRARQTVFWRLDEGFGTTSAFDLERLLSPTLFVRWTNVGTISESTEGVRWRSDLTLYHDIPGPRALAYTWLVRGETDAPVDVERASLQVVVRQQVLRRWLFLELSSGVAWPRKRLHEERDASWSLGFRVEVFFGEWPHGPLPGAGFD